MTGIKHVARTARHKLYWIERACCAGKSHLFFSVDHADQELAKHKCRESCPVLGACKAYVLAEYGSQQPEGIWAGMDQAERRAIIRHRHYERLRDERRAAQVAQ